MSARMTQHAPGSGTTGEDRPVRRADGAAAHSLRIGRIFGIPLQVHWSFLLLVALVVGVEWPAGAGAIVGGLIWVAALFACVVAHELAHCLLARRRGGTVLGILLLPIGGMSRLGRIPDRPADEAAIAAVGPATSLLLGGLFLSVGAVIGSSVWPPTLMAGSWWARLGWLNLLLGVFNLLPALPMDGGRVLRAALAQRLPRLAATRVAGAVARVLAVGLIVFGVFYDIWLVFIGVFVFLGASGEESMARAEELSKRQPPRWIWWSGGNVPPGGAPGGWGAPPQGGGGWYPPAGYYGPGWGPPPGDRPEGWYPPATSGPGGGHPPSPAGHDPRQTWWAAPGPSWAPPWGQQPSPRDRSAIDVAVERRRPDPGSRQPVGEGAGEHD